MSVIQKSGLLDEIDLCNLFRPGTYFMDNVIQFLQENHHYREYDNIYNYFKIEKNSGKGKILRELVMCPDDMVPDFGPSGEGWVGVKTEVVGVMEVYSGNPDRLPFKLIVYEVSGVSNHVTDDCQFMMFRGLKYPSDKMRRDHGIVNINSFYKPSHGYSLAIGKFLNVTGKV